MSETSLLQQIRTSKVEWKSLGEVVSTITAPSKVKSNVYKENGKIPIIDQGIEFIAGYTDEPLDCVKADEYIIFGDHSEHIKYVNFAFIQGADGIKILKPKSDNAKFIYYALVNFYIKELNYKRHWSKAKETLIPLPPLEIQQKIVDILDNFTELKDNLVIELEKEFTARKKQYSYYLNKLLSFDESIERKALGEVFDITAGGDAPKNELSNIKTEEFNIPVLSNGINEKSIYGWTKTPKITKPSLTVSARGTIGWASFQKDPFFPIVRLLVLTPKIEICLKYSYYYMKKIENNYSVPTSGIPQLTKPMIKDYQIPLPPLAEQERIVAILDKFDKLTNSISEGLPKEIELRHKQYEYYRNLLLDFPKID